MRHSFAALADMRFCERGRSAAQLRRVLMLLAFVLLGSARTGHAHDLPYSVVEISISQAYEVDIEIRCHTAALLSGQPQGVLSPPARGWFLGLSDADVARRSDVMERYLERSIKLAQSESSVEALDAVMPSAAALRDDARQDESTRAPSAPIQMSGKLKSLPVALTVRFPSELGVVLLKVKTAANLHTSRMIMPGDTQSFTLGGPDDVSAGDGNDWSGLLSYLVSGAGHILGGFDHLAFLAGLMLLSRSTIKLVKTLTAFTIAHSVTLCLTAIGIVILPSWIVEIGIAATIALLGVSVLRARRNSAEVAGHSWPVAFGFGLVHGMGLAGGLVIADHGGNLWQRLAMFNLGVEAGQLIFVAIVLLVLRPLDRVIPLQRVVASPLPGGCLLTLGLCWMLLRMVGDPRF